jgi:hypothetical protein
MPQIQKQAPPLRPARKLTTRKTVTGKTRKVKKEKEKLKQILELEEEEE